MKLKLSGYGLTRYCEGGDYVKVTFQGMEMVGEPQEIAELIREMQKLEAERKFEEIMHSALKSEVDSDDEAKSEVKEVYSETDFVLLSDGEVVFIIERVDEHIYEVALAGDGANVYKLVEDKKIVRKAKRYEIDKQLQTNNELGVI